MAYSGYKGFIDRLVIGKEKSETYARNTLPSNRWELFWDILKNKLGKLMLVNLLTLLFFIPTALLLLLRYVMLVNYGTLYPFSLGFGVGYMAGSSFAGLAENIVYNTNLVSFLLTPVAFSIAAVGISGAVYVIRNMVWTEGIFVANDFWRGIKLNFKNVLVIALIFSFAFYATVLLISLCNSKISALADANFVYYVVKILSIILLIFVIIMSLHALSLSVTYEMRIPQIFRNAFVITVAMPVRSLFFAAIALLPLMFLTMSTFFAALGTILAILISISWALLVWTDFSQWIFDKYINDKVKGAKKNRGIYQKDASKDNDEAESIKKYKEQLEILRLSTLSSKPIKPITDEEITLAELPQSFTRKDIEKLNKSRQEMYDDNARYVAEHLSDEKYKALQDVDKAIQKEDEEKRKRIEKARKELQKRNKNK